MLDQRGMNTLLLINDTIGQRIAYYRKERKLSQGELVAIVGVKGNHLSLIEKGRRVPSIPMLARLASALGVTIEELVGK